MRVLIVDDSGTARRILRSVLPKTLLGDVVEARSGREAVEICRKSKIDLMFLDLTMPDLDGYGVLAALADLMPALPVIVVSADVQPMAQSKVKELGARAFVKKTPNADAMARILADAGVSCDAA